MKRRRKKFNANSCTYLRGLFGRRQIRKKLPAKKNVFRISVSLSSISVGIRHPPPVFCAADDGGKLRTFQNIFMGYSRITLEYCARVKRDDESRHVYASDFSFTEHIFFGQVAKKITKINSPADETEQRSRNLRRKLLRD